MIALELPLLTGLTIGVVVLLAALWQRAQFHRTGARPVLTVVSALVYGLAAFASNVIYDLWHPAIWQRFLALGVVIVLVYAGLKWIPVRYRPSSLNSDAAQHVVPTNGSAYSRGRAIAKWFRRR